MSREHTPVHLQKGIQISYEMRRAYEQRDKSRDTDPKDPDFVRPTLKQVSTIGIGSKPPSRDTDRQSEIPGKELSARRTHRP